MPSWQRKKEVDAENLPKNLAKTCSFPDFLLKYGFPWGVEHVFFHLYTHLVPHVSKVEAADHRRLENGGRHHQGP